MEFIVQKYRDLPECSVEEQKQFFERARSFLETTSGLYSSRGSEALLAIADFLAAQEGKQLIRK